jgi:hypothetical protein
VSAFIAWVVVCRVVSVLAIALTQIIWGAPYLKAIPTS